MAFGACLPKDTPTHMKIRNCDGFSAFLEEFKLNRCSLHFPSLTHRHACKRGAATEKEYLSGAFLELLLLKLFHA